MKELEQKILDDIQKTGFASELNVVSILIENGWDTNHSETYEDKDERKSREIDIIAAKSKYVDELGFRFVFYLIIEVKKTDKPWIIFTTQRSLKGTGWRVMHKGYNDHKLIANDKGNSFETIFDVDCILPNDPRTDKFRVGKAFHEFGKTSADKSKIYAALITSCKAAKYHCDLFKNERKFLNFDPEKETELTIYLPIVILDGLLFEVFNNYDGKIKVQEQRHIPVEMSYSSPNYREGNWDRDFLPDIVTLDNLKEHLKLLENWRLSILQKMEKALHENGKKPFRMFD